jgi:hypothetical protein
MSLADPEGGAGVATPPLKNPKKKKRKKKEGRKRKERETRKI